VLTQQRNAILKRELITAERIPYAAHVAGNLVKTVFGDYVQIFRLGGASFESADDEQLNTWHERLNVLWRNIASAQVALWVHVVRRREVAPRAATSATGFADILNEKYTGRLVGQTLMVNEWYLRWCTVRPPEPRPDWFPSCSRRRSAMVPKRNLRDAFTACEKLGQTLEASLARYEPNRWRLQERRSGLFEPPGISRLPHQWRTPTIPLPRAPLHDVLATTRLSFGTEAIEYRWQLRLAWAPCWVSKSIRHRAS